MCLLLGWEPSVPGVLSEKGGSWGTTSRIRLVAGESQGIRRKENEGPKQAADPSWLASLFDPEIRLFRGKWCAMPRPLAYSASALSL